MTYNYGEDISKWGVMQPFTLNHTQTNNILAMFDGQGDTFYQLGDTSGSSKTTTLILDFGKVLDIRGLIVGFSIFTESTAVSGTLTSAYSLDGINYTQIQSDTSSAASTEAFFDHVAAIKQIRSLKLSINTAGSNLVNRYIKIFQVLTIV